MNETVFYRGDVILVEIPFAERRDRKLRPAVIIQDECLKISLALT